MGYSNGIVTYPVSIYDIRNAVGHTSGDLGTLIRDGDINMWAKYKPVQKAIVDTVPQLNSDYTWNNGVSNPWWQGVLGDYGIAYGGGVVQINDYSMVNALSTLATKINGGMNGWTYLRPSGGGNGQYRYLDFNRYNRNAPQPISGLSAANVVASATSAYYAQIQFREASAGVSIANRDTLVPSDIIGSGWLLSFAIFKKSGSTYSPIAWVTDSSSWTGLGINSSSGADGIIGSDSNVVITKLKSGATYYAIPFYCNVSLSQPDAGYSAQVKVTGKSIITIPYTNFVSFTATQRATSQAIAIPKLTNKNISRLGYYSSTVQLDSTVDGYYGGTAYNVTVQVVNENYNGTITQSNCALYQDLGSVSVGSNEVKNIYNISNLVLSPEHTWRVMVAVVGEWTTMMLRSSPPLTPV